MTLAIVLQELARKIQRHREQQRGRRHAGRIVALNDGPTVCPTPFTSSMATHSQHSPAAIGEAAASLKPNG